MQIPMSGPDITDKEIDLINQVLRTRYLSIAPMITRFEQQISRYIGTQYAVGASSSTAGLHLCIWAAGIGEGG